MSSVEIADGAEKGTVCGRSRPRSNPRAALADRQQCGSDRPLGMPSRLSGAAAEPTSRPEVEGRQRVARVRIACRASAQAPTIATAFSASGPDGRVCPGRSPAAQESNGLKWNVGGRALSPADQSLTFTPGTRTAGRGRQCPQLLLASALLSHQPVRALLPQSDTERLSPC